MYEREVWAAVTVSALHEWPDAPDERFYLRSPHRHNFKVTAWAKVDHAERDIEFHDLRDDLDFNLETLSGKDQGVPSFFNRSCESIAEFILGKMPHVYKVQVDEDESCGASVTRVLE